MNAARAKERAELFDQVRKTMENHVRCEYCIQFIDLNELTTDGDPFGRCIVAPSKKIGFRHRCERFEARTLPAPSKKQACTNCRHASFPEGGRGECRRKSPAMYGWPKIDRGDWCGSFDRRPVPGDPLDLGDLDFF